MDNNPTSIDLDLFPPAICANSSSTQTPNSLISPPSSSNLKAFFHPSPIIHKNIQPPKKKNKIFETTTHPKLKTHKPFNQSIKLQNDNPIQKLQKSLRFSDSYLNLLITSLDNQLSKGLITLDYINSLNYPKFSDYNSDLDEDGSRRISKKCQNPMCAIVVEAPDKIYRAKFLISTRNEIKLVCGKCYNSWKKGNYCFYCNVIYRDFEFNTQYYDRKKWIMCEYCEKWQHMQCEEKRGVYRNMEELVRDKRFKYMCAFCRRERSQIERELIKFEKGI